MAVARPLPEKHLDRSALLFAAVVRVSLRDSERSVSSQRLNDRGRDSGGEKYRDEVMSQSVITSTPRIDGHGFTGLSRADVRSDCNWLRSGGTAEGSAASGGQTSSRSPPHRTTVCPRRCRGGAGAYGVKAELQRTMDAFRAQALRPAPYFLAYSIVDEHQVHFSGSMGALFDTTDSHSRLLDVDLRVGTSKLDNTHHLREGDRSGDMFRRWRGRFPVPVDDDMGGRCAPAFGCAPMRKATVPVAELKKRLLAEIERQHKPYGLRFREIQGGFTNTARGEPQAFKVVPVVVYRVYPDGREEMVRGVDLEGTPLVSLSKILAAGDDYQVFNGHCGAESALVPVSAVSPSLLVEQIETARKQKDQERPPILSAPSSPAREAVGHEALDPSPRSAPRRDPGPCRFAGRFGSGPQSPAR
jgi:hypothetical protein